MYAEYTAETGEDASSKWSAFSSWAGEKGYTIDALAGGFLSVQSRETVGVAMVHRNLS